jgi:hypothetical protein
MMHVELQLCLVVGLVLIISSGAATCTLRASYPSPVVLNGWGAQLIAQHLTKPRSIIFDNTGNLLVVQAGAGIISLRFHDSGTTCLEVRRKTYLINSTVVSRPF